ncbi:phosphotransferase family protein [Rhodococcus opacus]|uniref:phosphotransferase family protein n=1 Tax=Rhodococcus opacus TaxID=37919 RepID=UPI001C468297|nr:phosphotransferase family protein [Rhodococcus opacus]MBV6754894.1 phosphotransferase family protein [Rhodococcus opacus]
MSTDPTEVLRVRLAARLSRLWSSPVSVTGLRRLSGGASRETWAFDAECSEAGPPRPLILRCDAPHDPRPGDMAREVCALTAARTAGVPVPEVIDAAAADGVLGRGYMIMRRIEGEALPRRLLRDPQFAQIRPGAAAELGRIAARIHTIPLGAVPELSVEDPLDSLTRTYAALNDPRPAIELGLRQLRQSRPAPQPPTVVHGDLRNGNILMTPGAVTAILDWELAHIGEPLEDLGWLCTKAWRFGTELPVGGFGSRTELLDGYSEVAGWRPTEQALRWWELYGTVRWAVLCRKQAEKYLSGADPSIELAVLGWKVREQEFDILLALGLAVPAKTEPTLPRAAPCREHPTVDQLLGSVSELLTDSTTRSTDARTRYLSQVAVRALSIARRELLLDTAHSALSAQRLARLGVGNATELALAVRNGSLDDRWDEVCTTITADVIDRVTVSEPRHLTCPAR